MESVLCFLPRGRYKVSCQNIMATLVFIIIASAIIMDIISRKVFEANSDVAHFLKETQFVISC